MDNCFFINDVKQGFFLYLEVKLTHILQALINNSLQAILAL